MSVNINLSSSGKAHGIGGKIFSTLFFLVFAAFGLGFTGLLGYAVLDAARPYFWQETACVVVASSADNDDTSGTSFKFTVKYEYEYGGKKYASETYSRNNKVFTSSEYGEVARLAETYKPDGKANCFVDPANPGEAVLAREGLWIGLLLLLPLVFVGIGVGGIVGVWRGGASGRKESISAKASGNTGKWILIPFFGVFFLMGMAFLVAFFIRPMIRIAKARDWPAVPCTVVSSEVSSHSGKSTTYSVNILYSYEFGGRKRKSNSYDFLGGSSSGYDSKKAVVDTYPPGSTRVCYVNPADPTEAVLCRDLTATMWVGLIPLVFVLIGAGGMVYAVRLLVRGDPARSKTAELPRTIDGMIPLKSSSSRIGRLFGVMFAAVFWNGIVSIFVALAVAGWKKGAGEWGLTIFLVPFVLVGLGFIVGVVYEFLALFNPKPELRVSRPEIRLGEELLLKWQTKGNVNRLRDFEVILEASEEARYRSGKSTSTAKQVFFKAVMFRTEEPRQALGGQIGVTISPDLMHSFDGGNNKIVWTLRICGAIDRWPDLKDEYEITVLPMLPAEVAHHE
ncbi:MAG: hypothetical protein C0404_07695 [Verrucomicrobia bacterium]|nr:hypothetical protein [Verrucomicrobiota bacterium]